MMSNCSSSSKSIKTTWKTSALYASKVFVHNGPMFMVYCCYANTWSMKTEDKQSIRFATKSMFFLLLWCINRSRGESRFYVWGRGGNWRVQKSWVVWQGTHNLQTSTLDCPIFTTALARVGIRGHSLLWNGVSNYIRCFILKSRCTHTWYVGLYQCLPHPANNRAAFQVVINRSGIASIQFLHSFFPSIFSLIFNTQLAKFGMS